MLKALKKFLLKNYKSQRNTHRGNLYVIEGADRVGKTSAIKLLPDPEFLGFEFVYTHEPGGTEFAEKLRDLFKQYMQHIGRLVQLLIMLAARADHVPKVIIPALENGTDVVCDRFSASTWAYQIAGGTAPLVWIFRLVEKVIDVPEPDLWILLEHSTGFGREDQDGFDSDDELQQQVREGLREYMEMDENRNYVIVNVEGKSEYEVAQEIAGHIRNFRFNPAC